MAITNSAKAQDPVITMSLGDYSSYADVVNLGTMTIPGNPTDSGYIGIYSFNVTSSGTPNVPAGTIWSMCLSPDGTINAGSPPANYYYEPFSQANDGINPSAWAWNNNTSNPQYWGIQNAAYLWKQVIGDNTQPNLTADEATGFALAVYAALYNSTGYGTLAGTAFDPNFGTSSISGNVADVESSYNRYLELLNTSSVEGNLVNGYVLVPVSQIQNGQTYGQEFLFLGSGTPNVTVPEPAYFGICAGFGSLIFLCRYCLRRRQSRRD